MFPSPPLAQESKHGPVEKLHLAVISELHLAMISLRADTGIPTLQDFLLSDFDETPATAPLPILHIFADGLLQRPKGVSHLGAAIPTFAFKHCSC